MKKIAGVIAVAVLFAVGWTSLVYGAPKQGKGLVGRIADALLGEKNTPGVLVPILEDEDATNMLMQEISTVVDAHLVDIIFDKRVYEWSSREIDKDARAVRFEDTSVVDFTMETEATVTRSSFFPLYKDDLKLTDQDQMVELSVDEKVVDTQTGSETRTKSRFRQQHQGIPVLGAQYTMYEKDGRLISGNGALAEGIDIDVTPSIPVEEALATALSDINAEAYSWSSNTCTGASDCIPSTNPSFMGWFCVENVTGDCMPIEDNPSYPWACAGDFTPPTSDVVEPFPGYCSEPEGTLAIVSEHMEMKPGSYHLAWGFRVYTATPQAAYDVLVDAHSGEVLAKTNPMLGGLPSELEGFPLADGQCSGQTEFNGVQDFTATHVTTDSSFPADLYVLYLEAQDTPKRPEIELRDGGGLLFPDNLDYYAITPDMGYCSFEAEDTLASSVWWALWETYTFYNQRGWNGLDGEGENPIRAAIVYSLLSGSQYLDTGIGSGVMYFAAYPENPPVWAVGLTDVAHEYTHGIIETTVPISFGIKSYEYAGLQEGIAMAMEQLINASVTGQPIVAPFYNDPKSVGYPSTYKGEYWPTPVSSNLVGTPSCDSTDSWCYKYGSIFVQWLRLMLDGGSGVNDNGYEYEVHGVGGSGVERDQVIRIVLRAIKDGLKPSDGFYEMREHTLEAVDFLIINNDNTWFNEIKEMKQLIRTAWAAVGVGSEAENVVHSPKNGDPDVKPWPVAFTWEAPKESEQILLVSEDSFFDSSFVVDSMNDTPLLPEPGSGIGDQRVLRKAKLNLRPDKSYYWKVVTMTDEDSSLGQISSGMGFSLIPWLKDVLGLSSGTTGPSDATYGPTPVYTNSSGSPVRYFKTSKMKPVIVAPTGVAKAHPWQASFVMGDALGAEKIWVEITDLETSEFERIIKSADEIFNDVDNTHVLKMDLKVDHHYRWSATLQGPPVNDGNAIQTVLGKESDSRDFWTNRPKVVLESPTEGMEVQPEAFFKWTEIPGIDDMLMNGANYCLYVSEHQDLVSNPVVHKCLLFKGERMTNLPPTNSAGLPADYYWSVLPMGPSKYGEEGEFAAPVHFTVDASATKPVGMGPSTFIWYGHEVAFRWMPVPNASAYEVQAYAPDGSVVWSRTTAEADLLIWADDSVGFKVPNVNSVINDLEIYHWDVRGIFAGNPGLTSDRLKLYIKPADPVIISPSDGHTYKKHVSEPVLFAWDAEFAPHGYLIYIYNGSTCSAGQRIREVMIPNENTRTYTDFAGSSTEGDFSWSVAVLRPDSSFASWATDCTSFKIIVEDDGNDTPPEDVETCTAPPTPTITAPEIIPFDTVLHPGTMVEWTASPNADHYRVVIKKSDGGPFVEKCQWLTDTTYTYPMNVCSHELMGTYQIFIYAESDSCYKVGSPASFIYYAQ